MFGRGAGDTENAGTTPGFARVDINRGGRGCRTDIDLRTGRTVYRGLAGTGVGYNHSYAGIAIARNGTEYLGTLGGMHDG